MSGSDKMLSWDEFEEAKRILMSMGMGASPTLNAIIETISYRERSKVIGESLGELNRSLSRIACALENMGIPRGGPY